MSVGKTKSYSGQKFKIILLIAWNNFERATYEGKIIIDFTNVEHQIVEWRGGSTVLPKLQFWPKHSYLSWNRDILQAGLWHYVSGMMCIAVSLSWSSSSSNSISRKNGSMETTFVYFPFFFLVHPLRFFIVLPIWAIFIGGSRPTLIDYSQNLAKNSFVWLAT